MSELEGWVRSLETLVPTPEGHREEILDRAGALEVMRCPAEVLDELVRRGLRRSGGPAEERYDRCEIANLALYSGSGRTLPEIGATLVRRMAREPRTAWVEPVTWQVSVELRCPRGERCGPDPVFRLARPRPERFGGAAWGWEADGGVAGDEMTVWRGAGAGVSASGSVRTVGRRDPLRSPSLAELFGEVLRGFRFQIIPQSLKTDARTLSAIRVGDCLGLSTLLRERCAELGYEVRVERGFLLGLLGFLDHAWVEVRDDDGAWKVLDATLALLVWQAEPGEDGEFIAHCRGSVLNRIVPCTSAAGPRVASHACGGEEVAVGVVLRTRRVAA